MLSIMIVLNMTALRLVFGCFEDGTFVNNGDGGYINWTFIGSFDREEGSGTVDFHKRF